MAVLIARVSKDCSFTTTFIDESERKEVMITKIIPEAVMQ